MTAPRVLSVAGTDPTGGAGVQADLKSIAAAGGYGMAVVTALVAQNTRGVRSIHVPPVAFLREQLDAVSDDVTIDAVKLGMLGTVEVVGAVGEWLARVRPPVVVFDPVAVSTSGDRLLDPAAEQAVRELVAQTHLVTPNIPELAILAEQPVASSWVEVLAQARAVSRRFGVVVLAKGGHLDGADVPDALVDVTGGVSGAVVTPFPGRRVETVNTHGTGCSFSSGVATRRVTSGSWSAAVVETKRWLTESLRHADDLDVGSGRGPINHFAGLWQRGGLTTRPLPGELRDEWWAGIAPIRAEIDASPFVSGLRDGSLPQDAFRWYLAQDALYLRAFARSLAEASRLAPTRDEQAFWALGAHLALATELQLHEGLLSETELAAASESATTTGYLDHLTASCAARDYGVLIAALLPCFWLYHDIGTRLHAHSHGDHPYREWLDTYADEAFAESTARAVDIVTRAASAADDDRRDTMWVAFRRSSAWERAFFSAPLDESATVS